MHDTFGYDDLVLMLEGAVRKIENNHAELSRLDSFGGDGDHGTTMQKSMKLLQAVIDESGGRDIAKLLADIGWAIMGADGGATGPLFGSFFMGMSEAAADNRLDTERFAGMLEAGIEKIMKHSRARAGDKTLIDALEPAVSAMRKAAENGKAFVDALESAGNAAETGAESTMDMRARFGRAKNLGEQSVGSRDPGASSAALMFNGFYEGLEGE